MGAKGDVEKKIEKTHPCVFPTASPGGKAQIFLQFRVRAYPTAGWEHRSANVGSIPAAVFSPATPVEYPAFVYFVLRRVSNG